ncbi:MAG TPA: hypothetical protein VNP04_24495 [Alphaproteobacteria bacterium]|nr:hypothetical protein [Alphaproteobacteria bacterium]
MRTVVGIFTSHADAALAAERLRSIGIANEHLNFLTPHVTQAELHSVPTTDAEQPGVGKVLGGVVGGVTGASGGLLGAAVASTVIPGVGPVAAIGLAAAALLGAGGAVAGAAAGGSLDNTLSIGLPKDELFLYEDALRQGRTVVLVLAEDASRAEEVRDILMNAGAESLDAARERWWLGLRDAEAETYTADGGDFAADETAYRCGFEAALHQVTGGRPYDEVRAYLQTRYPEFSDEEAFRRGYERGRVYHQRFRQAP